MARSQSVFRVQLKHLLWMVSLMVLFSSCRTPRYRYAQRPPRGAELRDLEQLIKDGQSKNPEMPQVSRALSKRMVDYSFENKAKDYRLGPQDILNVFVAQHPEMSSQRVEMGQISGTKIQADGNVYLPVLGAIPAAGRTIVEFRQLLMQTAAKFISDPQVAVEVLEFRSQKFFVLGQVANPGAFPVDGVVTLLEGLGLAGGPTPEANLEGSHVLRKGRLLPINLASIMLRGDVRRNVRLEAGDVVFLPNSADQKVYVLGEVTKPSAVPIMQNKMTLAEALAVAGGPTPARAKREIAILRGGYDRPLVYAINLETALLYDEQISLKPGDRVIVAPTGLSTASRYMEQLTPFLRGLQSIGFAIQGTSNIVQQVVSSQGGSTPAQ